MPLASYGYTAIAHRVGLAFLLVSIAQTTPNLQPFGQFAIHKETGGIAFQVRLDNQTVFPPESDRQTVAIATFRIGYRYLVSLGKGIPYRFILPIRIIQRLAV